MNPKLPVTSSLCDSDLCDLVSEALNKQLEEAVAAAEEKAYGS